MAGSFITNALGGTTTTTSFSITLPTTQAGDILILEFAHRGTGDGTIGGTSVTTGGLTWTLRHSQLFGASAFSGKTYWTRAKGNHSGETVTGSGLTNACAAIVTQYRGLLAKGDPLAGATIVGEQNVSGDVTQAEIVTTVANAWVVLVVVNSPDLAVATQACTSPGTLTERAELLSTGGTDASISHASAEKAVAGATGAFTWTQTAAASGSWAYALKPEPPPLPAVHRGPLILQTLKRQIDTGVQAFQSWVLRTAPTSETFSGSGTGTIAPLTGTGTGKKERKGSGAGTIAALVGSGTGKKERKGSGAGTIGALSGTGVGTKARKGFGAGTIDALSGAGTGTKERKGFGVGTIDALTGDGTGTKERKGSGVGTIDALTGAGSGTKERKGSGTGTIDALVGTGTGTKERKGSGAGTIVSLEGSGTGTKERKGSGTGTIAQLEGTGAGTFEAPPDAFIGAGTGNIDSLTGSGTGSRGLKASGSGTITQLEGSGTGTKARKGFGTGTLSPLTGLGIARRGLKAAGQATIALIVGSGVGAIIPAVAAPPFVPPDLTERYDFREVTQPTHWRPTPDAGPPEPPATELPFVGKELPNIFGFRAFRQPEIVRPTPDAGAPVPPVTVLPFPAHDFTDRYDFRSFRQPEIVRPAPDAIPIPLPPPTGRGPYALYEWPDPKRVEQYQYLYSDPPNLLSRTTEEFVIAFAEFERPDPAPYVEILLSPRNILIFEGVSTALPRIDNIEFEVFDRTYVGQIEQAANLVIDVVAIPPIAGSAVDLPPERQVYIVTEVAYPNLTLRDGVATALPRIEQVDWPINYRDQINQVDSVPNLLLATLIPGPLAYSQYDLTPENPARYPYFAQPDPVPNNIALGIPGRGPTRLPFRMTDWPVPRRAETNWNIHFINERSSIFGAAPPTPSATLNLVAYDTDLQEGEFALLQWSSTGLTSIIAFGGWDGAKPLSGTESVGPLYNTTAFGLRGVGPDHVIVDLVVVTVEQGPPPEPAGTDEVRPAGRVVLRPKQATDTDTARFDFISAMAPGDVILTKVVTARVYTGFDSNPQAIIDGAATSRKTLVEQRVFGGVPGVVYGLDCFITTGSGNSLHMVAYLAVVADGKV